MASSNGTLATFYLEHKDRLLTVAAAIVRERGLAEDVLHDVFARLALKPQALARARRPAAYLAKCVRNEALLKLRRRKSIEQNVEAEHWQPARKRAGPAETAERCEEKERLMALVGEMPVESREVLALRIWGKLGFREIAETTGMTKSTVYDRYRRAIETLRREMMKENRDG